MLYEVITYINNKLEEIEVKKIKDKNSFDGKINWVALQSRYFISSLIADQSEDATNLFRLGSFQKVKTSRRSSWKASYLL